MSASPYPPISDYALLGDCHSAALVSRAGSIDWCCFHRFDAHPVFARILDWGKGGFFSIAPEEGAAEATRRYRPGTNIVETTFTTPSGTLVLTDCIPVHARDDETLEPYHQLIRILRCTDGRVDVTCEISPRFDFGWTVPRLDMRSDRLGVAYGGADALMIQADCALDKTDTCDAVARFSLDASEECIVAVTYPIERYFDVAAIDGDELRERVAKTDRFWTRWSERCSYRGPYRDQVVRSALVAKALINAPSGAIVAAPTTSLPEEIGGSRNWDYRYSWLRDSGLNLYALFRLGYTEEAHAYVEWLKRSTAGRVEDLQTLYGVGGERLIDETELSWLEGYRGSAPVRIGNIAVQQFQLDINGYLLDTAWLYDKYGGEIDEAFWDFLRAVADFVCEHWNEPDQGIWEVRSDPEQFVHSKVLAWVALDRAVRLAKKNDLTGDLEGWAKVRDAIRTAILSEGVDQASGSFVRAFGSDALDAATLMIPLVRFLPATDPHVRATVARVAAELSTDGLVDRYRAEDGVEGGEGSFLICSFWLVGNLALCGESERATELFERLLGYANDVGLLSEEVDPRTGDLLGNFPQAFSHVGLIGAALNLEKAKGATSPSEPSSRRASP